MFLGFVFIRNMIILSFTGSYPVTENMHSLCGIYICIASSGKNHLISTKFGTQIRIWNLVSHNDQTWKFLRFKVADDFLQSFWAITRQPIVRFQWSFVQRSRIEWLLQSRDINSKFQKFKLANGRHIENRKIAISQRKMIRFWWNLALNWTCGTRWQPDDQLENFWNSRWRTTAVLKIIFGSNSAANFPIIWHG